MTKREGRISAFEMLFESDFRKDEAPQEIYDKAIDIREAKTNNFSRELFEKCTSHVDEIDKAVEECGDNWEAFQNELRHPRGASHGGLRASVQ